MDRSKDSSEEEIVFKTKLHWSIVLLPIFLLVLWLPSFGLNIATGLVGVLLLYDIVKLDGYEYSVTNKNVLTDTGLFYQNLTKYPLKEIEDVSVKKTIAGKIFGGSKIIYLHLKNGSKKKLRNLKKADVFKEEVLNQIGNKIQTSSP